MEPDFEEWARQRGVAAVYLPRRTEFAATVRSTPCRPASHHLIAECGFDAPEQNVESVATLAREGVVRNELAERLPRMVRFRNLLVHRYWQVDPEIVWESCRTTWATCGPSGGTWAPFWPGIPTCRGQQTGL
ncbi:MAG: DUF86 domain-containing protein [Candidatus Eremiobacterota bacterium]